VPGLLANKFAAYRELITGQLEALGYQWDRQILQTSDYGVAQLRPRAVLVAAAAAVMAAFRWPARIENAPSGWPGPRRLDGISRLGGCFYLGSCRGRGRPDPRWGLAPARWARPRPDQGKARVARPARRQRVRPG
jgi:site-specific DNA-cytosine methylase